jgi:hypothetical protein
MNDSSNNTPELKSVEEIVSSSFDSARQSLCDCHEKCESIVRESPTASVLGAVAAGYILHRLPVRDILVTQVRVISALAPPALILFGAMKLLGFLQNRISSEEE